MATARPRMLCPYREVCDIVCNVLYDLYEITENDAKREIQEIGCGHCGLTAMNLKRTPITKIVGVNKFTKRTYQLFLAVTFISLTNTALLNWLMCIRT